MTGAPIIAPPTAAIPQKGSTDPAPIKPRIETIFPTIEPVAVPINSAGANTNSGSDPVIWTGGSTHSFVQVDLAGFSGLSGGQAGTVRRYLGSGILGFQAEL